MDWGECGHNKARSNLQELSNTMFIVVICQVSIGKDILSPKQLETSYTDVRHWEDINA